MAERAGAVASTSEPPAGLATRRAAAVALEDILGDRATFEAALSGPSISRLGERDRAHAYNIVATSLRRMPQIEAVLATFLKTPIDARSSFVRAALISGAAQILFLASPPHAVVDLATTLAGEARSGRRLKGLVNAVLRRVAGEGPAIVAGQDAAAMVLPAWLRKRWEAAYGSGETRTMAAALLTEPPLDLTVTADPAGWANRLGGTVLASGSVRLARAGRIADLPGFADGAWWVQDAAAAVAVKTLGDIAGAEVIDLGAAPGGKTAQLAAAGAIVTAVERDAARIDRLKANLARLRLDARCVLADATEWRPARPADAVIVDAPCLATGIMRRHPDILRRRKPEHLAALTALQAALLDAAVAMTRPGGRIVYVTCSLEPEEGEHQITRLVDQGAPVERAPIAPARVPGFAGSLNSVGELRILPSALAAVGGNDGFFVASLYRT